MFKTKATKKVVSILLCVMMMMSIVTCAVISVNAAKGDMIFVEAPADWKTPTCYVWGGTAGEATKWPGAAMTKVEGNIWSYAIPGDQVNVVFNNAGTGKTDDLLIPGGDKCYSIASGKWTDYSTAKEPKIMASVDSGKTFSSETLDVILTLKNSTSGTYSVDGGTKISFTDTVKVPVGQGKVGNTDIILDVTATDGTLSTAKTFTYTKKFKVNGGTAGGSDGHTSEPVDGYYSTNASNQFGGKKTITVDGSPSDWDSSMLIAQGIANDDPRVYCQWSMHETPIDDYALYASWDDANLYLMWEMTNVQDIVAPGDDFPLSQGNLWIYNLPIFLALSVDNSVTGNNGKDATDGTIWGSGITFDSHVDTLIALSTNGSNGPFIYKATGEGFDFEAPAYKQAATGMAMKWGNGILSKTINGLDGAGSSSRKVGDTYDAASNWKDFSAHNSSKLDMTYEVSIPLEKLGIDKAYIESTGIGLMKVSTFGTSGMNSLPHDPSMIDNAALPYSNDPSSSNEKEDKDNVTVPFARIGKALSGGTAPAEMQVNFGADKSSPQAAGTAMNLQATAYNGTEPYSYAYEVNGKPISGTGNSVAWTPTAEGDYTLKVTATDSTGKSMISTKLFTVVKGTNIPPVPTVKLGDVNNDTKVNMKDVSCIQDYLVDTFEIINGSDAFIAADVTKDGKITMKDVKKIQDFLTDIIGSLD